MKLSEVARKNASKHSYETKTIIQVKNLIIIESMSGSTNFELSFNVGFNFDHIVKYLLKEGFDVRINMPKKQTI